MTLQPPFALFVLVEIDNEYINNSLTRAWKSDFEAAWEFWVATDKYDEAPQTRNDNELPEGCSAVAMDFKSPWIGKTVEDCAEWLRNAPANVALNKGVFVAMNEFSKSEDTILTCRIPLDTGSGEIKVEYFPQPIGEIGMHIHTNLGSKFEEKAQAYQTVQMNTGRPDRSQLYFE